MQLGGLAPPPPVAIPDQGTRLRVAEPETPQPTILAPQVDALPPGIEQTENNATYPPPAIGEEPEDALQLNPPIRIAPNHEQQSMR
jgi:hypothetical protein